jgi:hypothetical protein
MAGAQRHRHHQHHHEQHDEEPMGFVEFQRSGQITRQIRQRHVIGHVKNQYQSDALQHRLPLLDQHIAELLFGRAVRFAFALVGFALECWRFFKLQPDIQADYPHRSRDQERNAPSPGEQRLLGHRRGQHGNTSGAQHIPDERTELEKAAHETALLVRRKFRDERRRAAILAAR